MPAIKRWLVIVVAAVFMAACSDSSADPSSVSPGPTTVTSPSTTTAPTPTTATPSPGRERCPLTAEDVSKAIGTTVTGPESTTTCHFGTPIFPSSLSVTSPLPRVRKRA
jgi:hypothetical protein